MVKRQRNNFDGRLLILNAYTRIRIYILMEKIRRLPIVGPIQPLAALSVCILFTRGNLSLAISVMYEPVCLCARTRLLLFLCIATPPRIFRQDICQMILCVSQAATAYKIYNQETTLNVNVDPELQTPI